MMDELNRLNNDQFCRETAALTRKLLDLETECVKGHDAYDVKIVEGQECNAKDTGQVFNLTIPYFGTVKVSREVSLTNSSGLAQMREQQEKWFNIYVSFLASFRSRYPIFTNN